MRPPAGCNRWQVYVPGAFGPNRAFFSLPVCTTAKPADLTVWRFQAGV
jgi:hypothetical protein